MTKKRGIPECILLVTQRMTKYPLLIDTILKTTKGTEGIQLCCLPETAPEIFIRNGILI